MIADHTAYKLWCRFRSLSGIAMVSMSIYLLRVSNWSLLLLDSWSLCFVAVRYKPQQKCLKKWIESAVLRTWQYNFQALTLTPNANNAQHRRQQTNRETRETTVSCQQPILLSSSTISIVHLFTTAYTLDHNLAYCQCLWSYGTVDCGAIGSRALSFSGPLLSVSVEFCLFVGLFVRNFVVKYLGNQRR